MAVRGLAIALAVAACGAPPAKPASVANSAPKGDDAVDGPLQFDGDCDLGGQDRLPINDREKISIVTCAVKSAEGSGDDARTDMTAYLVRGPSATRGRSHELGTWTAEPEQGQSYSIDMILRRADGVATHVLIRHGTGGLDQLPEAEMLDYLPASDTFGPPHRGLDIGISAHGATAQLVVCTLTPGGTYYQDKDCRDQQGAKLESFTIGP
jgi:hypothetical protein